MAFAAKSTAVAALTGTAAFAAAAAGLSNSSTPTQFGLAGLSALLSGALAYWQAESKLVHPDDRSGRDSGSSTSDAGDEIRYGAYEETTIYLDRSDRELAGAVT